MKKHIRVEPYPAPLNYKQLIEKSKQLHAELEGLAGLSLENNSVINDRKVKLLELIDQNLDVQSIWWPAVDQEKKPEKVCSDILKDYIQNPDLSLEKLGARHNLSIYKVSRVLSTEMKGALC